MPLQKREPSPGHLHHPSGTKLLGHGLSVKNIPAKSSIRLTPQELLKLGDPRQLTLKRGMYSHGNRSQDTILH